MIAAGSGDHTCRRNFTRQHVGKRAARLERSGVLQEFEFEDDPDRVETNVRAIDFEDWSAADVRPDNALSCLDSLAREFACLSHRKQYSRKVAKTQRKC